MFEQETINLYKKLHEEAKNNFGDWSHSPVEGWKVDYFRKEFNEKNLINFKRSPLCEGTINPPDRPIRKGEKGLTEPWFKGIPLWQKIKGLKSIILSLIILSKNFKLDFFELSDESIGNPCYYGFGKTKITDLSIRMFFYQKYIEKEIKSANSALEIGSGFGALCAKLMQSESLGIKNYFLVDLPENLALAFYYLKNKGFNVEVFGKDKKQQNSPEKTIYIVAPWLLKDFSFPVDLFINTMSFQHMTEKNINYYFSEIERLKIKKLFLVNRENKRDSTDVRFSDYPIPAGYKLVKQDNYPFSKHLIKIFSQ